ERRVFVTAAVDDGQLPVFVQPFEACHASAETEVVVDGAHFLLRNAEVRAMFVIRVVAVGDQRIEAVVAAGQLQYDQNLPVDLALSGQRRARLREQRQRQRSRRDADAIHAGPQEIPPGGIRE